MYGMNRQRFDYQTAKDIAATIARSNNRVYLTADSLLLNIMSDSGANEYSIVMRIDDLDVCLKKSLERLLKRRKYRRALGNLCGIDLFVDSND